MKHMLSCLHADTARPSGCTTFKLSEGEKLDMEIAFMEVKTLAMVKSLARTNR